LTGHLVFSTLHTNDAVGAITRLVDMGIEPFLLTSAVEAFLAQRLVRMNCPDCKKPVRSPEAVREIFHRIAALGKKIPPPDLEAPVYQSKGCEHCKGTGYQGRSAIYEILEVTDPIKALILRKASAHEIKKEAVQHGMRPLIEDGWEKVKQGVTTIEEMLRVTQLEE
jgi:type II secretory ATPase GspE/PulE/Tfp pilus assembly ATPase PilB-like protein